MKNLRAHTFYGGFRITLAHILDTDLVMNFVEIEQVMNVSGD